MNAIKDIYNIKNNIISNNNIYNLNNSINLNSTVNNECIFIESHDTEENIVETINNGFKSFLKSNISIPYSLLYTLMKVSDNTYVVKI